MEKKENKIENLQVEEKIIENKPEIFTKEEKNSFIYKKMKIYFLLLGIGSILPWNSLLAVMDFIKNYQDEYKPDTYYAFYKFLANILLQIYILYKEHFFTYYSLLIFSFTSSAFSLFLFPVVVKYVKKKIGFIISVIIIIILGLKNATLSNSLFGLVSYFPKDVIIITSTGQGFSGIIMNVLEMIIKVICQDKNDLNAFILFILGGFTMWFDVYIIMDLYKKNILFRKVAIKVGVIKSPINKEESDLREMKLNDEKKFKYSFVKLSLKLLDINLLMIYIYIVTFAVFPAISLKPNTIYNLDSSWTNNILVSLYNIFDILGRYSINFTKATKRKTYINVLIRTIFLITTPYCWILFDRNNNNNLVDLFIVINISLLGFTNGTSTALCYAIAPLCVEEELKGFAGSSVSFFNIFGIFLGTIVAFGTVPLTEKIGNIKSNS